MTADTGRARRGRRWLVAGVALALLVAGHVYFWYAPRMRVASGDPGDLPLRLLADDRYALRLWLPYPHQNVARLASVVDDPQEYLAAISRLAERSPPALPRFGPFALPPARELTAAYDEPSGQLRIAARVYPGMALVARLGGLLAANPWLAGGEVRLDGRAARVAWRGTLWTLSTAGAGEVDGQGDAVDIGPSLAAVGLNDSGGRLPSGIYGLQSLADPPGLRAARIPRATTGQAAVRPLPEAGEELLQGDVVLVAASGADGPLGAGGALMLLRSESLQDGRVRLPSAAALSTQDGARWTLPGEDLGELLGLEFRRSQGEDWQAVGLDSRSLEAAEALASPLSALVTTTDPYRFRFGLWLRPREVRDLASGLRRTLDAIPLVARRKVRYWHDVEIALEPFAGIRLMTLEVVQIDGEDHVVLELTGTRR